MNANNEIEKMLITNLSVANFTRTTTSIPVFDYYWQYDLNHYKPEYLYGLIGIVLNIIILIISAIKKRDSEQTYRIVIVYIAWLAIVRDLGRIMYYVLFDNLFSCMVTN